MWLQVWHEKWGEDYAREGDACLKWTDRWSETNLPDGRQRAQGDKWREEFGHGNGNKTGETWHADENGHRCAPCRPPVGNSLRTICMLTMCMECCACYACYVSLL